MSKVRLFSLFRAGEPVNFWLSAPVFLFLERLRLRLPSPAQGSTRNNVEVHSLLMFGAKVNNNKFSVNNDNRPGGK